MEQKAQPRSDNSFLFKSKFQWDDIKIVKQYDGNPPVLNIKYVPEYEELMDYFRGILHSGEVSERAFEISGFVVKKLCSNYNAWHLRQQCLEKLDSLTFEQELEFVDDLISDNQKVFQIWDHRRYIIEKLNDPKREIDFLEDVFEEDNKNYHAWSYRIWLCQTFSLYQSEWQLIQKYFVEDIRNNSAWNYRFFLFKNFYYKPEEKNIKEELQFVIEQLKKDFENEAAWNYLQGFFKHYEFNILKSEQEQQSKDCIFKQDITNHKYFEFTQVEDFCKEILKDQSKNRFLIATLVQINATSPQASKERIEQAITYTEFLAEDIDRTRINYWKWVQENIKQDFKDALNK